MATLLIALPYVVLLTSHLLNPTRYRMMNIDSTSFNDGNSGSGQQQGPHVGNPGNLNYLRNIAQLTGITDASRLNDLVQYSLIPVEVLRQHGVDPSTINLVEIYRALLQRTFQAQQGFKEYPQGDYSADAMTPNRVTNPMAGVQPYDSYPRQPPQVPPEQRFTPTDGDARPFAPPTRRPSTEELQRAHQLVLSIQKEFQLRAPTITFRLIELPEYQQLEYHETFEQLHGFALEIHSKLPIFACYMHEDVLRRLYTLLFSTFQQKSFLTAGPPRYFMSLEQVRGMCKSLQGAVERYNTLVCGNAPRHQVQTQPLVQQQRAIPTQDVFGTADGRWVPPTAPNRPQGFVATPPFPASSMNSAVTGPGPPSAAPRPLLQPFDAILFPQAFQRWCSQYGIVKDETLLTYEGRSVDLYALHSIVMHAGGAQRIARNDQWNIVGGQLGFAQIPGNNTQPPRSGPQMAQRIAQVYEKYLFQFDMAYMRSILHSAAKDAQQTQQGIGNMDPRTAPPHLGAGSVGSQQNDQMNDELTSLDLFGE